MELIQKPLGPAGDNLTKDRKSLLFALSSEAQLSYQEIARIAKCSHGSVHAELVDYKKEKEAAEKNEN